MEGEMVLLANYVLDSLPGDVFAMSSRGREEDAATGSPTAPIADAASGLDDPSLAWTGSLAPTPYHQDLELDSTSG